MGRRCKLTGTAAGAAHQRIDSGEKISSVAADMGVGRSTLYRLLYRYGLKHPGRYRVATEQNLAQARALISGGMPLKTAAVEVRVSPATLRRHGLKSRQRRSDDFWVEAHRTMTARQAAALTGLSWSGVRWNWKRLRKKGLITFRKPSHPEPKPKPRKPGLVPYAGKERRGAWA